MTLAAASTPPQASIKLAAGSQYLFMMQLCEIISIIVKQFVRIMQVHKNTVVSRMHENTGAEMDTAWFKQRMKACKVKQEDLANAIGRDRAVISRVINGTQKMQLTWAKPFAELLGVSEANILKHTGINIPDNDADNENVASLRLCGEVQAGAWQEAVEYSPDDQESYPIYVGDQPGTDKMFLLKARGDSMNMANAPEGTLLICMKLHDFLRYRDPKSGDRVIVHRTDDHGLVEATVKELEIRESGEHWLWPRSNNPEHQQPIKVPAISEWADGHAEVSIHAVVIGYLPPLSL